MKKLISLLLCLVLLASVFTGCSVNWDDDEEEDKGATIPVYLTGEIKNFDPAFCYTDEGSMQLMGLLYEGLTTINEKGKVEGALAKKWTYEVDDINDTYILEFTLNTTYWSDGRQVSADDLVYAWKRIMEPEFHSEAASMLYQIKNAKAVKTGDVSIDDLGVYALDTSVFAVEFIEDIDVDTFLMYCASPMLVPLREDAVNKVENWSSNVSSICTSGPFTIRNMTEEKLVLERNIYYYRNFEKDALKKSVTPYRLAVDLTKSPEEQLAAYDAGEVMYVGYIPLAQRSAYAEKATMESTMNTHTYFFNTTKAPFDNADVRKALSMAIDRQAIADLVVFADPANGIINADGVYGKDTKTSFRAEGGDLISSTADLAGAKSLISSANPSVKDFSITVRAEDEISLAVADYCKTQWEQLGFTVTVNAVSYHGYATESEYDVFADRFSEAFEAGEYDVIALDWEATSATAWSTLASFAKQYAGGAMDLLNAVDGEFVVVPHITGYDDEAYNALIEEIYALKTYADRNEKLHQAEQMLVDAMPVMPLFTHKRAYLLNDGEVSKTKQIANRSYTEFHKAKLKSYDPETTAAAQ